MIVTKAVGEVLANQSDPGECPSGRGPNNGWPIVFPAYIHDCGSEQCQSHGRTLGAEPTLTNDVSVGQSAADRAAYAQGQMVQRDWLGPMILAEVWDVLCIHGDLIAWGIDAHRYVGTDGQMKKAERTFGRSVVHVLSARF